MASWGPQTDVEGREQVFPHPKPEKRHKASQSETAALKAYFKGSCCVHCGLPYQHRHHIAFRKADSGDDIAVNIAPICLSCHDKFHSRAPGWERVAASIRVYVLTNRSRCSYVIGKIGWDRFNKRYPLLSESAEGAIPSTEGSSGPGAAKSVDAGSESDEPIWRYHPVELEPEGSESVEGYG